MQSFYDELWIGIFKFIEDWGFGENLFKVAVGSAVKITGMTDVPRKGLPPCRF